jgi:glycerophosphoryl diester phosphodiesterase
VPPARTLRLAHRGDWRRATENTLPAFLAATALPDCDGLEFDVRLSGDGVPVVIHDETLERTHGRRDRVDRVSADTLGDLGVPSLADVLAAVPRRAFLDVELKLDTGRAAVEVLASGRGADLHGAVVSSFDIAALERVGGLAAGWPRWLNALDLARSTIDRAVALGCSGIAADWRAIDSLTVAAVRSAGLDLAAWTVRRRPTVARLTWLGVVAVCVEGRPLDG